MKPIVTCQNVHKVYQQGEVKVHALRGIDLDVDNGEFMALAGPSGSGKTTLLNLIGALDRFDEGQVMVNDYKVSQLSARQATRLRLQHVGFIFQAYNLIPVLSAIENVEYIMLLQGISQWVRREKARAMLDEVGLEGLYDRRPHEMSGGQQQRVAVARALVSEPDIILADEPTANLDSETAQSLLEIMKKMNQRHAVTFIFSTHDKRVMDNAHRVVTLRDGRVHRDEKLD